MKDDVRGMEGRVLKRSASKHWGLILFAALALALIGALGLALFQSTKKADESQLAVARAEQVLETLARLREQLALMESNQRGFLLAEDDKFLHERDAAIIAFGSAMQDLGGLINNDPSQRARFDRMSAQVEIRLGLIHETIKRYRSMGVGYARAFFDSGAPQETNRRIREIADEIFTHDTTQLAARRAEEAKRHATTRMFLVLAGVAGLAIMIPLGITFASQFRAREDAERRLLAVAGGLPGTIFQLRIEPEGQQRWSFLPSESDWPSGHAPASDDAWVDAVEALSHVTTHDREQLHNAVLKARQEGTGFELDFRVQSERGAFRWIRSTAVLTEATGSNCVWTGYWCDVTESKGAEQALRNASERLNNAQRVAQLGDWSYDLGTGLVDWSPTVYALLARDPALGPPTFEEGIGFYLGNGSQTITDSFARAVETGETQRFELQFKGGAEEIRHLEVIAIPRGDSTGQVSGLHGTIQDVTERYRVAERLQEAKALADAGNHAKSIFLATMSHEIRTPMFGMVGLLELLALTPLSEDQRVTLDIVRDSGRALQRIIDDILDYSKIEAGKLEIVPEPTSLARVMDGVHRIYSGSASRLGLMLDCKCDPGISPALWVDGLRLRQILGNLVSNALKFTERGRVDIRAELVESLDTAQRVRFVVQDTGIGMTEDQQRTIFEPFVQAGTHAGNRASGTGLGLAISARLAEQMEGRLQLQSQPGVGTTMAIEMTLGIVSADALGPQVEDSPAVALSDVIRLDRTPPETDDAEAAGMLVLVVDDHPINRLVLQSQLSQLGYACLSAEDGRKALKLFEAHRFGLVITDCNMPVMTGYELARSIRDLEASSGQVRTPVIACTANVLDGEVQHCIDAGMDDNLSKPASLAQLFDKLNRWLPLADAAAGHANGKAPPSAGALLATAPAGPFNAETLQTLALAMQTDIQGVISHFKQVNDVDVSNLRDAVRKGDAEAVTRFAHRMRGAGNLVGVESLGQACAALETAAREGNSAEIEKEMERVERELNRIEDYVASSAP